jgi:hypothetical protein
MTRTLYLHIGAHKTGTTSIQSMLASNTRALAARDFAYVVGQNRRNMHGYFGRLEAENFRHSGLNLKKKDEFLQRFTTQKMPNLVASSENFSHFFDRAAIQEVADLLRPHFDVIRIISYLRRQDQLAISHHQEGAKPLNRAATLLYGNSPTALPEPTDSQRQYLDFATRIGHWGDAFGDAAITLRLFGRETLKSGDAVADFLDILGLDPAEFRATEERNTSMGLAQTKTGHILNEIVDSELSKARVLARIPDGEKMLPRREDALRFVEPYLEGNLRLNARFHLTDQPSPFSEDFSDYPESGREEWDEATANAALRACAQVIHTLSKDNVALTVTDLSQAALALQSTLPETAMKFLRAALAMKPGDAIIQQRLAELETLSPREKTIARNRDQRRRPLGPASAA